MSAFYNTELDTILRGLASETLMISGVLTNQCVAGTMKDAMYRDYKSILIEDCCGTTLPELHEPTVMMARVGWGAVGDLKRSCDDLGTLPEPVTRVA